MNGPFKLKSGNSPLFKNIGSSPLTTHRRNVATGRRIKHKGKRRPGDKTWAGRAIQNIKRFFTGSKGDLRKTAFGGRDKY